MYDPAPVFINTVKRALKEGRPQFGCSVLQFRSPDAIRALRAAGLDWVFLDAEHGPFDLETLHDMMRVAVREGLCPIVRVADLQYNLVARALDSGAQGVLLPRVESPELLEKAVSWTRYPPIGVRGYGLGGPHLNYEPVSMAEAIAHQNEHVMVVFQIESKAAMARMDELLSVPNIDAVLIGPADLSVSLGIPASSITPTSSPPSRRSVITASAAVSPRACTCDRLVWRRTGAAAACSSSAAATTSACCSRRRPRPSRRCAPERQRSSWIMRQRSSWIIKSL